MKSCQVAEICLAGEIGYFFQVDKYDLSKYKTRLVFAPNDLIEKMNIFELGLNDEAIEIIKYSIYEKNLIDKSIYDCLYFDGMNNADLEFVSFSSKTDSKEPKKFVVQSVFYNKIVDDISNFKNRHRDYFEVIDEEWVQTDFNKTSQQEV